MLSLTAAACATPSLASDPPIVFAAASLKSVLDEISEQIVPMRLSYGGSGALARQIQRGAPADVFLSANPVWMGAVAAQVRPDATYALLTNDLVVVASVDAPLWDLSRLPEGRIAMGFVDAVPAGQYGKAAFEALGLWNALRPLVVETENVRAALALAARGEVAFAVTYLTDALAEPRVKLAYRFAPELHPPVLYPVAALSARGVAVVDALRGQRAAALFRDAGFGVL